MDGRHLSVFRIFLVSFEKRIYLLALILTIGLYNVFIYEQVMEGNGRFKKKNIRDSFHILVFLTLIIWVTTLFEFHCFPQQINGSLLSKLSPSGLYDLLSCRSLTRTLTHKNERHTKKQQKQQQKVHGGACGRGFMWYNYK